ncbi:MAG: ABC transporter ATP-binding protein [Vicinamibacterales bacterium]|nr:ATP-binding protein [Acidobacteriota bacterium]MDP6371008.1 ABC transporter ATP-binding protein [Vicinamibacterales bacterium]MDP6609164.1 ABC transporter ATP-binding protein [Vicinamibacterales bacterium]HAK57129.1 ATP-binding protein [Acidobacteriota bacterium]
MLEISNLSKAYPTPRGELPVLRDVSLSLQRGESASIMGPSGSGKSTLLYIIGALEPPSSGRVIIGGDDPFALGPKALAAFRNRAVGFVFQDHLLLPQCTVVENVLLPTLVGEPLADGRARALDLLGRVGLSDRLDHRPAELSGGEKQRVAIARALIRQPPIVLCDEPTGNLDRESAEAVASLLLELHREQKSVLAVVTHSPTLADRFGRRLELNEQRLAPRRMAS